MISEYNMEAFCSDEISEHQSAKNVDAFCEICQGGDITASKTVHLVTTAIKSGLYLIKNTHYRETDPIRVKDNLSLQQMWPEDSLELAGFFTQSMPNLVQSFFDLFCGSCYAEHTHSGTCKSTTVQYWSNFVYGYNRCQKDGANCEFPSQTHPTFVDGASTNNPFPIGFSESLNSPQHSAHNSCDIPTRANKTGQTFWTFSRLLLVTILLASLSLVAEGINSEHTSYKPCQITTLSTSLAYERHPANCSIFYTCYGSTYWKMTCEKHDTVFSVKHKVCVWRDSIFDDCHENSTKLPDLPILEKDKTSLEERNPYFNFVDKSGAKFVDEKKTHKIVQRAPEIRKSQKETTDFVETFIDTENNRRNQSSNYLNTQVRGHSLFLTNQDLSKHNFPTPERHSGLDISSPEWELNATSNWPYNKIDKPNRRHPELVDEIIISKDNEMQGKIIRNYHFDDNNGIGDDILRNNPPKSERMYNKMQMNSDDDWPIDIKDLRTGSDQSYDQLEPVTQPSFGSEELDKATYLSYDDNYQERATYPSINIEYTDRTRQKEYFDEENFDDSGQSKDGYLSNESIDDINSLKLDEAEAPKDKDDSRKQFDTPDYKGSEETDFLEFNQETMKSLKDDQEGIDAVTQDDIYEHLDFPKLPVMNEARSSLHLNDNHNSLSPLHLNDNHKTLSQVKVTMSAPNKTDDGSQYYNSHGSVLIDYLLNKSWLLVPHPTEMTPTTDEPVDLQDVLKDIQKQEQQNSLNNGSPSWKSNADSHHIQNRLVPKFEEDFNKTNTTWIDFRHDKIAHDQNHQHHELEENSSFQRNERNDAIPSPLSTHTFNKNREIIPSGDYYGSASWYINNRETYTTKERINPRTLSPSVTKPPHKMAQENVLFVQPWPEISRKFNQTRTKVNIKQTTIKTPTEVKAIDNPRLMQTFLRLLNLTDHREVDTITEEEEFLMTKNQKNKYTNGIFDNYFKVTTNEYWPTQRPTQSWKNVYPNKQTTTKSPVVNWFPTSTPETDSATRRYSKNRNVNIIPPRPTDKHEDLKTDKNKDRFIFDRESTRKTFHIDQQHQNQYWKPRVQQNQHYQQRKYEQEKIHKSQEEIRREQKLQEEIRREHKVQEEITREQKSQENIRREQKSQEEMRNKQKSQEEMRNKRKQQEEMRNKRKQQEEMRNKRKQQEEMRNKQKSQEEMRNKRKQQEEMRNKRKQQEDMRNKREQEEEMRNKRKQQEEMRNKRKQQEEMRNKRKQQEEMRNKREQEEEMRNKRKQQEEMRNKREPEEEMRNKQKSQEEMRNKRKQEEEMRNKRKQQEEMRNKRKQEEEMRNKREQEEEMRNKRKQEEEMRNKRKQEEEMRNKREQEEEMRNKRKQQEEMRNKMKQQEEMRNKRKQQEEMRNKMKSQEKIRNKMKQQEEMRNEMKQQEEMRNKRKQQEEMRNKMKQEEEITNKMKSQEKIRNKMKQQEEIRNKKGKNPSLKNDDLKAHQPWFWKRQPKQQNNFIQNRRIEKSDKKFHDNFPEGRLNDKNPPDFLQSQQQQNENLHRFKMQQFPTFKSDSEEDDDSESFEFQQKRNDIKNKIDDHDLKNLKLKRKEYLFNQNQIDLDTKLNRTFVKRPELKSKWFPILESDKFPWKDYRKYLFEAQPGPDGTVPPPTARTSPTTTSSKPTTAKKTTPAPCFATTTVPGQITPPSSNTPDYVPIYRHELKDHCGIMATPLIIGGQKSRTDQWPWQVSLQIVTSTTPWHRCGGVLVHSRWVLTAAHCMEGPFYGDISNWRVVMADYDLEYVSGSEIYRDVVRVISHPGYVRTSNFPNDVALLELDSPLDLTSGEVQTACLPDEDFPLSPGTRCWISGWGETRGSGGQENTMNEVLVDVLPHDDCKSMWGRVNIDVLDSQVCLGYGLIGACYGDSGGPLMCESDGRFYVAGVMSWLINNCSANNFPNVFTRLPNYMEWVYQEIDLFE